MVAVYRDRRFHARIRYSADLVNLDERIVDLGARLCPRVYPRIVVVPF